MVDIPESYLLTFLGVIFVPLFIFLMKMIIEQGNTKTKIDSMMTHIDESKDLFSKVFGHETEIKLIKQKLIHLENEIRQLFSRNRSSNMGDRDGSYFPDGDINEHGA